MYVIMVTNAECSTQSIQNDILIPSTVTWKYVQDEELEWRLVVKKVVVEGKYKILTNNLQLPKLGHQVIQFFSQERIIIWYLNMLIAHT